MAHTNADCGAWVTALLEIGSCDSVLEVGFGPGVIIQRLSKLAAAGHIAGIDPSQEMVAQARARNDNRHQEWSCRPPARLSVEHLPFDDNAFDKAPAINSMQVWPDSAAGLREMRRVIKPSGRVALGFYTLFGAAEPGVDANAYSGWPHEGDGG